jgi:3-methyladenine DNA glycosylase/8-oxoguanine DNA glycosylase
VTLTPAEPIRKTLHLPFDVDLGLTLGALWAGPGDARLRIVNGGALRATRTPAGPATLRLMPRSGSTFELEGWGPGAECALDGAADLLGAADDPAALTPRHALIADLVRRRPGLRMTRTGNVFEALLPAIVGQKVTGFESANSSRALMRRYGEVAPGPPGLLVPPDPRTLAAEPYWRFHSLGLERRRADVIRRSAALAGSLQSAVRFGPAEVRRRLVSVPGIGPWTAAETVRIALGDPDAVSVGDYHIPNLVSWVLAGEPRGTDERMLELLRPYEGQRARVVLLLELSGLGAPRFGPRMPARSIAAI